MRKGRMKKEREGWLEKDSRGIFITIYLKKNISYIQQTLFDALLFELYRRIPNTTVAY